MDSLNAFTSVVNRTIVSIAREARLKLTGKTPRDAVKRPVQGKPKVPVITLSVRQLEQALREAGCSKQLSIEVASIAWRKLKSKGIENERHGN